MPSTQVKSESGKLWRSEGLVTWASPTGLEPVFCDHISLPSAALGPPFSSFSLFFSSAPLAGGDGREAGEWQAPN